MGIGGRGEENEQGKFLRFSGAPKEAMRFAVSLILVICDVEGATEGTRGGYGPVLSSGNVRWAA